MQLTVQYETTSEVTVKLSSISERVDRPHGIGHMSPLCCAVQPSSFYSSIPFLLPPTLQRPCPCLSCHSRLPITILSLILFHHFDHHCCCLAHLPLSPNTVSSRAVSASRIHVTCFTPAQPDMCMLPDNRIASLR